MERVFALVVSKVKLAVGEALNLLTNLLVPAVDLLLSVAAVVPGVPKSALSALHKVESALQRAGTTLEAVEEEIKKVTK